VCRRKSCHGLWISSVRRSSRLVWWRCFSLSGGIFWCSIIVGRAARAIPRHDGQRVNGSYTTVQPCTSAVLRFSFCVWPHSSTFYQSERSLFECAGRHGLCNRFVRLLDPWKLQMPTDSECFCIPHNGELPVSLSGPIANPTTRHLDFCSLVLSQLDST
jgi:hypothetical protein